jgi:hypothetical protein
MAPRAAWRLRARVLLFRCGTKAIEHENIDIKAAATYRCGPGNNRPVRW